MGWIQSIITDPQEDPAGGTDFKDIWVSSDANYIYVRFTLYKAGDPNTYLNNIFIDADNDPSTGYAIAGIGSEMLIQSGAGYQEKNGGFNEGGIEGLDFAVSPEGEGTDFELRISRKAKYANDAASVFTNSSIRLVLETENSGFATTDLAPDSGGVEIVFPQGPLAQMEVKREGKNVVISWEGPGQLQTRPSFTTADWVDVPDSSSPYTVLNATGTAFFRLSAPAP